MPSGAFLASTSAASVVGTVLGENLGFGGYVKIACRLVLALFVNTVAVTSWALDSVDTTESLVRIDPLTSTVTGHRTGFVIDPQTGSLVPASDTWDLSILGTFVVKTTEYGFDCLDGPFPICQGGHMNTIQLIEPQVEVDTGNERPFEFPTFVAYFNNPPDFEGDNGSCSVLLPGEHCTGVSSGQLSSFEGMFDGAHLSLTGVDPGGGMFEDGLAYTYQINASVVSTPLPAAFWLLSGALAVLFVARRRPD